MKEDFDNFQTIYNRTIESLEKTKINLNSIKNYYENFSKFSSKEQKRYVIANLGYPNTHKSSALNFLMTGSYEFPLPNSFESINV